MLRPLICLLLALATSCTAFTDLNEITDPEPDPTPEPDTSPEPEPDTSPTPEPSPEPDPTPEPTPDVSPDPTPDVMPDVTPDPQPVMEPEPPCEDGSPFHPALEDGPESVTFTNPSVAHFPFSNANERILVAWQQDTDDGDHHTYFSLMSPRGVLSGPPGTFFNSVGKSRSTAAAWDNFGVSTLTIAEILTRENLFWSRLDQLGTTIALNTGIDTTDDGDPNIFGIRSPTLIKGQDIGESLAAWIMVGGTDNPVCDNPEASCLRQIRLDNTGPVNEPITVATGEVSHPALAYQGDVLMTVWQEGDAIAWSPFESDDFIEISTPSQRPFNTRGVPNPPSVATFGRRFVIAFIQPSQVEGNDHNIRLVVVDGLGELFADFGMRNTLAPMRDIRLIDLGDRLGAFWIERERDLYYAALDSNFQVLVSPTRLIADVDFPTAAFDLTAYKPSDADNPTGVVLSLIAPLEGQTSPFPFMLRVDSDGGIVCP